MVDGNGILIECVITGSNCHNLLLLRLPLEKLSHFGCHPPKQITVYLDASYDSSKTHSLLEVLDCKAAISQRAEPLKPGVLWIIEKTNSWHKEIEQLH